MIRGWYLGHGSQELKQRAAAGQVARAERNLLGSRTLGTEGRWTLIRQAGGQRVLEKRPPDAGRANPDNSLVIEFQNSLRISLLRCVLRVDKTAKQHENTGLSRGRKKRSQRQKSEVKRNCKGGDTK